MRRLLAGIFALTLLLAGGCAAPGDGEKPVETLRIVGSTSMLPLSEKLARKYEESHPGVRIYVQGGDSSLGLKGVAGGIAEIGSLSRPLNRQEKDRFNYFRLTTDEIVIIVNPNLPVSHLTLEDLKGIFSGSKKNWKEMGGPDLPITVITREQGSGTYNVFREAVMGRGLKIARNALVMTSTGAVKTTVARDRCAIGYISSRYLSGEVRPLPVDDGKNKSIIFSRPLVYITDKKINGATRDYIDFVLSDEGKAVIDEHRLN
ncbi:phosphate ABC transporter periplasmic phosphate-binding protein PstS [Desulfocucumis palustris]|uniref:Phosphate ABC transporter periplasmic phosphate-binding protein PstS n=1 Tax=Desulfocucumis palustris TaxID=1898651 RepID=A0A2L2XAY3_9FIRM|nr:phosphate ABC transporter substrate-binding protein [Desulfocucumis palustris]GBF33338.1 phosphate ABC transporter periplasmic phosphate-binding protein PstS [Desulfocucumis palustris]